MRFMLESYLHAIEITLNLVILVYLQHAHWQECPNNEMLGVLPVHIL
jgi:hypothetical protein